MAKREDLWDSMVNREAAKAKVNVDPKLASAGRTRKSVMNFGQALKARRLKTEKAYKID